MTQKSDVYRTRYIHSRKPAVPKTDAAEYLGPIPWDGLRKSLAMIEARIAKCPVAASRKGAAR
jgi:hypothetical protein